MGKGANGCVDGSMDSSKMTSSHTVSIPDRDVFTKSSFNIAYNYEPPPKKSLCLKTCDSLKKKCGQCGPKCVWKSLKARIPILSWIFKYSLKDDLFPDIVAGITVGIMQIPQAMAYAMLSGVPAVVGLYSSFFPVIIYCLMGTSRHVSVGTFAVICLMVGRIVNKYAVVGVTSTTTAPSIIGNITEISLPTTEATLSTAMMTTVTQHVAGGGGGGGGTHDIVTVAVAATFCVGCLQVLFGFLHLGSLSVYMSDILISGYTTASACFVFTSQIPSLLGVKVKARSGLLSLFDTFVEIANEVPKANTAAIIISVIAIAALLISTYLISPPMQKKFKIPFPMDLVVIIVGTLVSTFMKLDTTYKVSIVGYIPTGIPAPKPPDFNLVKTILVDSVATSIVAFSIALSMAKVFAKKHQYNIDANQELIAHGTSNIFGSFFSCVTSSVSLSRSLIMEASARTQVAALFSSVLLLIVLLWLAPLLEALPKCVLASIIVVALRGMFRQVTDLLDSWKISKSDAAIWLVAFVSTVLLDVDLGLLVGIAFSLVVVLFRAHRPKIRTLGRAGETDIYEDVKKYMGAQEFPGIKIFQFGGSLYYANRELFREKMYKHALDPKVILRKRKKQKNNDKQDSESYLDSDRLSTGKLPIVTKKLSASLPTISDMVSTSSLAIVTHVVLDCSCWSFIDGSALSTLTQLVGEYNGVDCKIVFAACKDNVLEILEKSPLYSTIKADIFPTVHDAVMHCFTERSQTTDENTSLEIENTADLQEESNEEPNPTPESQDNNKL